MSKEFIDAFTEYMEDLGTGGAIDIPDCAVGAICAQMDVETAKFCENVKRNFPQELNKIPVTLKVVHDNGKKWYGYKVGVDADGVVHEYKGTPVQKILNIWNYGTADNKTPRTMFWGKAVRRLKRKEVRAEDRFYKLLDDRAKGNITKSKSHANNVEGMVQQYNTHKAEYLYGKEVSQVGKIQSGEYKITGE